MRRDDRIDLLRGICVLGMVVWHLLADPSYPRWLSFPAIQAFNFVAEGFVLLAGVSVALAHQRRGLTARQLLLRAVQILLACYALIGTLLLLKQFDLVALPPLPADPLRALSDVLLLRYQPYLPDALTVFVFLFALAPILLWFQYHCWEWLGNLFFWLHKHCWEWPAHLFCLRSLAAFFLWFQHRCGDAALLIVSLLVALASQTQWLDDRWVLNNTGAFDVNTWQFIFCCGLVAGRRLIAFGPEARADRRLLALLLAILAALAVIRYLALSGQLAWFTRAGFDNRSPLRPMRMAYILTYLATIALVIQLFWPRIRSAALVQAIVTVGRHSLWVFWVSVVLDYVFKHRILRRYPDLSVGLFTLAVELALLYLLALWLDRPRRRVPESSTS